MFTHDRSDPILEDDLRIILCSSSEVRSTACSGLCALLFVAGIAGAAPPQTSKTSQAAPTSQSRTQQPTDAGTPPERTSLNGELELARLIDLCASKLRLTIEYDAAALKGAVTIRLGDKLTNEELWSLANELLASRGFASVQRPGSSVISIVKTTDAPASAKLERPGSDDERAGFTQLVIRAEHREPKDIVDAIKNVLSKPSGSVTPIGDKGWLLIADYRPRIEQAMYVKSLVDVPSDSVTVLNVPVSNLKPADLVTAATAGAAAREEAGARKLKGKLLPSPDGAAVIVMAPAADLDAWKELLSTFDRKPEIATRSYAPKGFTVAEVSQLVQQIAKDAGPHGSGDKWKAVVDELTGTLVVTATPSEHASIAELIARLDATPGGARRQLSIFTVRNRPVSELLALMDQMLSAGSLSAQVADAALTAGPPSTSGATTSQRTERDVMPPGNAPSVLGTSGQPAPGTGATAPLPAQSTGPNSIGAPSPPGSSTSQASRARSSIAGGVGPDGQPLVTISADEATNSLIVVAEPRIVKQIEDLLRKLDVRKAQVMLEVLVTSLNDQQAVELGVELEKIIIDGNTLFSLTSLFGLRPSGVAPPPRGEGFTGAVLDPGSFSIVIRALEKLDKGRTLNMPRVLVGNNQSANLTSVLQQPVLSTNASVSVATTSFGGTQDAGTTVTVKPQIAEGDHLLLDYSVAISSFIGTSTNPSLPPPRQQNTLQSVVAIPDGFTVAVGGLQIDRDVEAISQIPLIGNIPIIGEAFKNRSRTIASTRFFVFLKASILRQQGFEDLKYLSTQELAASGERDRDFPAVEPLVIK